MPSSWSSSMIDGWTHSNSGDNIYANSVYHNNCFIAAEKKFPSQISKFHIAHVHCPLIDGQMDLRGNWNFTLQKIFHNTFIIYHNSAVTINIIGSSTCPKWKFLAPKYSSLPPEKLWVKVPKRVDEGKFEILANSCSRGLIMRPHWLGLELMLCVYLVIANCQSPARDTAVIRSGRNLLGWIHTLFMVTLSICMKIKYHFRTIEGLLTDYWRTIDGLLMDYWRTIDRLLMD